MITLYHAPRQGRVGWGVGWGVLSFVECWSRCWCSAADGHVVSCSATGQGGVGGGVGCIIVRGMLITLLMLRCRWSCCIMLRDRAGWGGVYYRSWDVDHVVDAPCSICLVHAPWSVYNSEQWWSITMNKTSYMHSYSEWSLTISLIIS